MNYQQLQPFASELVRQNLPQMGGGKTAELIKFALHQTTEKHAKLEVMRSSIHRTRPGITTSLLRAYFIGFMAKDEIGGLEQLLERVETSMLNRMPPRGEDLGMGRTSFSENHLVQEVQAIEVTLPNP